MPLPDGGNTPWPPKECEPVNAQYAVWSAWYSGDAERLAGIYAGEGAGADTTGFFASEAGGFRGAVRGAVAAVRRWFWGSRAASTSQRTRLHVPLAGDIASASADLLFSEPPTFTIPTDTPAKPADGDPEKTKPVSNPTQDRLDELVADGLHATLLEAAEVCAALSGVYLRIVWDPEARPDRPWITAVHPDVAVPEWAWGDLAAVTFWRELKRDGKIVVRHLERHEKGKILHGVYSGTADELGQPVPLTDYPETAQLAALRPDGTSALVNGNEIVTGAEGLTAVYVPNMRPNRIWRNAPTAAYLGRSDYSGVEPLMDSLDMVYSSWMRDVDLGKARLIVPRDYLQSQGKGQGATIDLDQEVYEAVNSMPSEDGKMEIKEVQFDIRVEAHSTTVDKLKATIVGSAGYSAATFGLAEDGQAVTATEIAAKNRRSLITRDRKSRYWIPQLASILHALLQVDATQFGTANITPVRPDVEFAPNVSADPLQQAQTLAQLATAEAISTEEKVRTLHPEWGETEVAAEVKRIQDDRSAGMPGTDDPFRTLENHAGTDPTPPPNGKQGEGDNQE